MVVHMSKVLCLELTLEPLIREGSGSIVLSRAGKAQEHHMKVRILRFRAGKENPNP